MARPLSDEALFARLVSMDTTSFRSNREMYGFLAEYLDRPGVRITENPSPDGSKANLVVEMGPQLDGADGLGEDGRCPGLTLSGHMDVVPAGEGWTSEPFELTDRGDRWVARGSADMKGFVALAANAFARREPASLTAPLALVFTYDEELGCLGAGHFAETWPRDHLLPRATVIGEPTSLRAMRMHKGHFKVRLTFHGLSAHSGYPHLGANAVEPAGHVIAALSELRAELSRERPPGSDFFPDTPYVAFNLASVHGGSAINVVPDRCVVELGFRLLPGMEAEPVLARVREAARRGMERLRALPTYGEVRCEIEELGGSPPMHLREEAPVYRTVCGRTGQTETHSACYGTDGGWFSTRGMDCVIFGPGSIEVAHKPDEFIPKDEFYQGREHVEGLIDTFCTDIPGGRGEEAGGG